MLFVRRVPSGCAIPARRYSTPGAALQKSFQANVRSHSKSKAIPTSATSINGAVHGSTELDSLNNTIIASKSRTCDKLRSQSDSQIPHNTASQTPITDARLDISTPNPTIPPIPVVNTLPNSFLRPNQIPPPLPQTHLCTEFAPRICVVGVGGAGGNAVNNMISRGLEGVEFLACNTDAQHLATTLTDNRLQIGRDITQGLGCGANPDVGRHAAEESKNELLERIGAAHMVFVAAGMGGGTGTGCAPIIAQTCLAAGILTVAVVTRPFRFEGTHRSRLAEEGIRRLQDSVDSLLVIPNQNLFRMVDQSTTLLEAFRLADDVLLAGVKSVTDLMTQPGLINLDFADVQAVMQGMGNAIMGTGQATGEDRALRAAEDALKNPLLGDVSVKSAKGMLVNITGGPDMTLHEVDKAAQRVTEEVEDQSANIIFGSAYEGSLAGEGQAPGSIRVSVVATGIEEIDAAKGTEGRKASLT